MPQSQRLASPAGKASRRAKLPWRESRDHVTGVDVDEIVVRDGRAAGVRSAAGQEVHASEAVIATTTPGQLYGRLLRHTPGIPRRGALAGRGYRYRRGCFQSEPRAVGATPLRGQPPRRGRRPPPRPRPRRPRNLGAPGGGRATAGAPVDRVARAHRGRPNARARQTGRRTAAGPRRTTSPSRSIHGADPPQPTGRSARAPASLRRCPSRSHRAPRPHSRTAGYGRGRGPRTSSTRLPTTSHAFKSGSNSSPQRLACHCSPAARRSRRSPMPGRSSRDRSSSPRPSRHSSESTDATAR
jgi:hypothetical protein